MSNKSIILTKTELKTIIKDTVNETLNSYQKNLMNDFRQIFHPASFDNPLTYLMRKPIEEGITKTYPIDITIRYINEYFNKYHLNVFIRKGSTLTKDEKIIIEFPNTNDNFNIIKQKLQEMQKRQEDQIKQQQEAEQNTQMQLQQMQNEQREQELMLEEAKMDLERYKIDADNQTKIAVAEISTYRGTEEKDVDNNGIPDPEEMYKIAMDQQKIRSGEFVKDREMKYKKNIEDKKIELERDRMKHEMELQKQKDNAALERERIKARTARVNKVSGEK